MGRTNVAVDSAELYRRYGPMVHRRCRALLKDNERALEATQDVFVQVLRREASLDVHAPSALLWQIATNVCLNHIRSRGRRPEDADDPVDGLVSRIACVPDPDGRLDAASLLDRLFDRSPPSTRAIATMHLLDGMTFEEIAADTGLSVSGVRKRLRTLRTHLIELEAV